MKKNEQLFVEALEAKGYTLKIDADSHRIITNLDGEQIGTYLEFDGYVNQLQYSLVDLLGAPTEEAPVEMTEDEKAINYYQANLLVARTKVEALEALIKTVPESMKATIQVDIVNAQDDVDHYTELLDEDVDLKFMEDMGVE